MIEIEARTVPENWFKTADALIFLAQNKETATRCRCSLLKIDPITKTLREANSWHSAATWNNLGELDDSYPENLANSSLRSTKILDEAVSLLFAVKVGTTHPKKIQSALITTLAL